MPAEPRKANLTGTVLWDDTTPFTGYVKIGIAFPTTSDPTDTYAMVFLNNQSPPQRLPRWYKIPILQGVFDQTAKIYFNADINPINTKYVAYYYDINNNLIAGPTALFTVTSGTVAIAVPTLSAPVAPTVAPSPPPLE